MTCEGGHGFESKKSEAVKNVRGTAKRPTSNALPHDDDADKLGRSPDVFIFCLVGVVIGQNQKYSSKISKYNMV